MTDNSEPAEHGKDEAEVEPAEPARTRRRRDLLREPWAVPTALSVVLAGLLAASLLLWLDDRQSLDDGVVATAQQQATNFFSLDYKRPDASIDRVLSLATDPFKTEYSKKRDTIKKSLTEKQLSVSATVPDNGAAIEYLHGDKAQVLVAVNTRTTADDGNQTESNRYRARIELVRVGEKWLVSGVEQVG